MDKPIIFYDGYCNLCKSSVQFVLRRDRKGIFDYIPLQEQKNTEIKFDQNLPETVFLKLDNKLYKESDAVIRILILSSRFKYPLYVLFLIPKFIRNFIYKLISKNRYRWFGKKSQCFLVETRK